MENFIDNRFSIKKLFDNMEFMENLFGNTIF